MVPSLIYIFLRGFGDNKFEIPVFYEEGISIVGCNSESNATHLVQFEAYDMQGAQLFYFPQWVDSDEFYRQCDRIKAKQPNISFTAIADTTLLSALGNVLVVSDEIHLYQIANCALIWGQEMAISKPIYNQLVLVDKKKQIRGYYLGNELEEMDRLDIELDILKREVN